MDFYTPLPLENQFSSVISVKEAAEGISVTLLNAKELFRDAEILFENGRNPRAIALAILSIEEYGKIEKIKELLLSKQKIASLWRDLRSHKSKNYFWLFPLLKNMGITNYELITSLSSPGSNSVKFLDQLKQICFYTEAIENENGKGCLWWLPSDITDADLAKFYLETARVVVYDDGIHWTEGALRVYIEYNYYKDGTPYTKDQLAYYRELKSGEHITDDRYQKILKNLSTRT